MRKGDSYLYFYPLHDMTSVVLVMALAFAFDVLVMPFDLLGCRLRTRERGDFSLNLGTLLSHIQSNPIVPASFT